MGVSVGVPQMVLDIVGNAGNPGNPKKKWMIWEDTSGSLPRLIASPCRTAVASPNAVTMTAGCWFCAKLVCPKMRDIHWKPNIHGICQNLWEMDGS